MENNQPLFSYGRTSAGLFSKGEFQFHFNPNGFYNNKNSWISDDLSVKIIWDTTLNAWKLSGSTLGTTQVINQNPNYPPINGDWRVVGANYTSTAKQGECPPINTLKSKVDFNNPTCSCNGTINVSATGGVAPYQYSYDNGLSYVYSPIKTELCGGVHIVKIKDSVGTIVTETITMADVELKQEYILYTESAGTQQIDKTTYKKFYNFVVKPPLPPGITITFDLDLSGPFNRTPTKTSAIGSFIPRVTKNTDILNPIDETIETEKNNTYSGCQGGVIYTTNYSYKYKSITMNSTDTFTIEILSSFQLTCTKSLYELPYETSNEDLGPLSMEVEAYTTTNCCYGDNYNQYINTSNPTISGCNCCTVKTWSYNYNRS